MKELTPRKIVAELDKYIVGQKDAKKAVAIAIRNRWRRLQLSSELREEVMPKNIIMIGPTGVGKTEIARRMAGLVKAPFLKVEASKYTEVGYHGRDVESMIRDIVEVAVNMVRTAQMEKVSEKAEINADEKLLDLLLPLPEKKEETEESEAGIVEKQETTREKFRSKLKQGELEDRMVEIKIQEKPVVMQGIIAGIEEVGVDFQNIIEKMIPPRSQVKKAPISEARKILKQEEAEKLVDKEKVIKEALYSAENMGIIFIDELDKIASRESGRGPDISREGVQRDILPIVEGSTVTTRYGMVKTDRILFIAAGAFHVSKPSDLIPELQGRFPIRVELKDLGKEEFIRILTEPKNALIKQYTELLKTEGVKLRFEKDAIDEIADIAVKINRRGQSIGARRLYTVMEKLLEDDSFDAPELSGKEIVVDAKYVLEKMKDIVKDEDLTKYIL
jgi:ATP-dependent HslUV protease ATP-binding subunit HslU